MSKSYMKLKTTLFFCMGLGVRVRELGVRVRVGGLGLRVWCSG